MEIRHYNSPNFSKKTRPVNSIKLLVIHYTGMQSERESIKRLCNPNSKVSCHYLVSQNGKIFKLVKETHTAWHAGKSCWGKYKNLNENSIGIELVNRGHQFGYAGFKTKQILALVKLCKKLIIRYKIKKKNIVGHSDIAPLRKKDPGEKFPWKYLSKKKIGIWHDCKSVFLTKNRKLRVIKKNDIGKFTKFLIKIGYCVPYQKKRMLFKIIKAFQRRFRNELINGVLDQECLIIAKNLAKKL